MEVKNLEIFGLFTAPRGEKSLYRKLIGPKWPGTISYEITKMGKLLNNQFSTIDEARVNIIEAMKAEGKDPDAINHLEPDDTPGARAKAEQDNNEFAIAFGEVLDKTEEIAFKEKIKIPVVKLPDIEPEVLLAFDKFLSIEGA